jgi:hypothetical protein
MILKKKLQKILREARENYEKIVEFRVLEKLVREKLTNNLIRNMLEGRKIRMVGDIIREIEITMTKKLLRRKSVNHITVERKTMGYKKVARRLANHWGYDEVGDEDYWTQNELCKSDYVREEIRKHELKNMAKDIAMSNKEDEDKDEDMDKE